MRVGLLLVWHPETLHIARTIWDVFNCANNAYQNIIGACITEKSLISLIDSSIKLLLGRHCVHFLLCVIFIKQVIRTLNLIGK